MTKYLKIGSAAAAIVIVAGLIFFVSGLYKQIISKDADIRLLEKEIIYQAYQASIDKARIDTIEGVGTYTEIVDTTEITDTLYLEPGEVGPVYIPRISGFITLNTARLINWGSDSLSIRVKGRVYYPARDSLKSWLLIYPESGKPPERPIPKPCPNKSIGVMMAFNSNSELIALSKFRYKRFSVYGGYSIPGKYYLMGMGLRLMEW